MFQPCEASAYAVLAFIQKKFSFKRLLFPTLDPDRQGSQAGSDHTATLLGLAMEVCSLSSGATKWMFGGSEGYILQIQ